eukprot:1177547-Prorocentrum_minimum.AAC.3
MVHQGTLDPRVVEEAFKYSLKHNVALTAFTVDRSRLIIVHVDPRTVHVDPRTVYVDPRTVMWTPVPSMWTPVP